jgi:DNA-binding CsgD family transcriptional regulator
MNSPLPPGVDAVFFEGDDRKILALLCAFYSNKQIASALGCSVSKIKAHITGILKRTRVQDRAELLGWILQHEEDVRMGTTRKPGLHPTGCKCHAGFCTSMRRIFDPPEVLRPIEPLEELPKAA